MASARVGAGAPSTAPRDDFLSGVSDVLTRDCWVRRARRKRVSSRLVVPPARSLDRSRTRLRRAVRGPHADARPPASPPSPPPSRTLQGCGLALHVPKLPSGADSPAFRCTWCLAINDTSPLRRHPRERWRALERVFARWAGRALIVVVSCVSLAVGWAIIAHTSAVACGDRRFLRALSVALTLAFLFNVFWNYVHAAAYPAGSTASLRLPLKARDRTKTSNPTPTDGNRTPDAEVPRRAFEGCRLCVPCRRAKPPGAHHCRTCGACVRAMDHHCPFLGNCVGADNVRHFLLFTGYVSLGNAWGLCTAWACARGPAGGDALATFWRLMNDADAFARGYAAAAAGSPPATAEAASAGVAAFLRVVFATAYRVLAGFAYVTRRAFAESPDWVGWWVFLVGVGGVICALTAGLFWSTLFSVAAGDTYLEALRRRAESERGVASGHGDGDVRGNLREGEEGDPGRLGRWCGAAANAAPGAADCVDWACCGLCRSAAGPAPWSKIGMFHLRQVFGGGHPVTWGMPRARPPPGARGAATKRE